MGKKGPKFYETSEFKALYKKWVVGEKKIVKKNGKIEAQLVPSKLARSGFKDIESPKGILKVKNIHTQSYRQQEELQRISSALMNYIHESQISLKGYEKRIIEYRSRGMYRKEIMKRVSKSHQTVWKTLKKHIPIALALWSAKDEVTLCSSVVETKGDRDEQSQLDDSSSRTE